MTHSSVIIHTSPPYLEGAARLDPPPDEMSRRRRYGQLVAWQLAFLQSGAPLPNEQPEHSALHRRIRGWSNPGVRVTGS